MYNNKKYIYTPSPLPLPRGERVRVRVLVYTVPYLKKKNFDTKIYLTIFGIDVNIFIG